MNYDEKINTFAEDLSQFFVVFDSFFLFNKEAESLLIDAKKSLEKKILHNESALPLIIAMGGNYDSGIDRAKIEQITALIGLIKARKKMQEETIKEQEKKDKSNDVLKLFGL